MPSISDAESAPVVVYRHPRSGWWIIPLSALFSAACCALACLPLANMWPLTPEEIAKKHIESNVIFVWLAFAAGVLMLSLIPLQIFEIFVFRLEADEKGVRWRPFLAWKSARWDEITDCLMINNGGNARIIMGARWVTFNAKSSHWPELRDFVAAHVALPDGWKAWHEKPKLDAEARRANAPKDDDGAVLRTRSSMGFFALFGALVCGGYALSLHSDVKGVRLADFVLLFVWACFFVAFPLALQFRDFVRADDEGLLIGEIRRQRRVRWADIEDLFLLKKQRKSRVSWTPCVVVAGETIELSLVGKARDAILNRIEARAIYSSSRHFEQRQYAPIGNDLTSPAILDSRFTQLDWLHKNALLTLVFAGSAASVAWTINNLGWENFGSSRGMIVWAGALWSLLLCAWLWRAIREARSRRAQGAFRIAVDDAGLSREDECGFVRIEWAQVTRLECDCTDIWNTIFRVESANGAAICWHSELAESALLTTLAREKCDQKWRDSARVSRLMSGWVRTDDGLFISDNNAISRLWACLWLGIWALMPSVIVCDFFFDSSINGADSSAWPIFFLPIPPIGFALYLGLAALLSIARVRTRCDAEGLVHRGWFVTRQMKWEDVTEVGPGSGGLWDFVRANDGRTIRIWLFPLTEAGLARRELRDEIRLRAPHAQNNWKTDC